MRLLNLSLLLGAAARAVAQGADDDELEPPRQPTFFNGKKVPPMLELTPHNIDKEMTASKYLMVKHYE